MVTPAVALTILQTWLDHFSIRILGRFRCGVWVGHSKRRDIPRSRPLSGILANYRRATIDRNSSPACLHRVRPHRRRLQLVGAFWPLRGDPFAVAGTLQMTMMEGRRHGAMRCENGVMPRGRDARIGISSPRLAATCWTMSPLLEGKRDFARSQRWR